jgi:serine/threonine protein kinase
MKIVINTQYKFLEDFIRNIPEIFEKEGELVYQARNKLKVYDVNGLKVIVKSYKRPHLINRIAYTFFRPSKAKRSYEYAFRLLSNHVDTPDPVAYLEDYTCGLLDRSYYISLFKEDYDHIRLYMTGEKTDPVLITELSEFIADFHKKGIHFLDISPGNILQKKENGHFKFCLVDINRMQFKTTIPERTRYKSFKKLSSNPDVIIEIARQYAKSARLNGNKMIKVLKLNTEVIPKI